MKKTIIIIFDATFIFIIAIILLAIFFSNESNEEKWITFSECKQQEGEILPYQTPERLDPICPEGTDYLGKIKDSSLWKICCK